MATKLAMKYRCVKVDGLATEELDPSNCPEEVMNLYTIAITASIIFGARIPECSCRCDEDKILMMFESDDDVSHVIKFIEKEGRKTSRLDNIKNCVIIS